MLRSAWGRRGVAAAAGILWLGSACAPDAGPSDLETPDAGRILVYFPIGEGGLVRGRAFPGTFSSGAAVPYAVIRSHPTSLGNTVIQVNPDGGFDFALIASGREVLEIAGATDRRGEEVGPSVFVEVPAVPVPAATFRCCRNPGAAFGACLTEAEYEERLDPITELPVSCPTEEPRPVNRCTEDRDCVVLSRRHYEIARDRVSVSRPDEEGEVVVRGEAGAVPANALVLIENRQLQGVGRDEPSIRRGIIANADGSFASDPFFGKGDDEIVLEVVDLNDFRSPTLSLFVEDPDLESAQILEVWPYSDLSTQLGGFLGVKVWLTGIDGRGLCPDAPAADPAYCFSGGLQFEHLEVTSAYIDQPDQTVTLCPALRATDVPPSDPPCGGVERLVAPTDLRGLEGDVRAPPEDIALIVDLSSGGASVEARDTYFANLGEWIGRLRARDRIGVRTLSAEPSWSGLLDRDTARAYVEDLRDAPTGGGTRLFAAVAAAGQQLQQIGSTRGRIVLTAISGQSMMPDESNPEDPYYDALEAVQVGNRAGAVGFPVDIVGIGLTGPPPGEGSPAERRATVARLLDSLAAFSGPAGRPGRNYGSVDNVLDLRLRLRDVGGQYVGGFNLLFEIVRTEDGIEIIDTAGKLGELSIRGRVTVPTGTADVRWDGPLEFQKLIAP